MVPSAQASGHDARFGDYQLQRHFTAGGMADLYLARCDRFGDRPLLLKRIQPRYLGHEQVVRMFLSEGRIASLLDHPNVVRVVEVGQVEGDWYIAMEHIHGHDLVAVGRRAAEAGMVVPRAVAVGVMAQVAAGLDYAHRRLDDEGRPLRIVHCDVSPGNVVISFDGVAKIVDFGIARATIALREEGGVAGKYNYMAPEQVRGEPFDARADLFPLGVMLHELTVGRRLFRGRPEVVMRKVCDEPIPRPSELSPDYPEGLERIVMRLLERDPAARYPSAEAVRVELLEWLRREERGWDQASIAVFLDELFRAPRQEATDPALFIGELEGELEVDRGMPEPEEPVEPSALVTSPPQLPPPTPGSRDPTEHVRLPEYAGPVEPTARRRRRDALASYALVAGSVLMLALAALVAWLIAP